MDMEYNDRFFSNKHCKYFPCHEGLDPEEFNCMFCYCPLNYLEHCPGNPTFFRRKDGSIIKDCTGCTFPHKPENYEIIINFIKKNMPVFDERVMENHGDPDWVSKREKGKKSE